MVFGGNSASGGQGDRKRMTWLGRLGWAGLGLFLIGWAFALGVMVGQGSLATPEQVQALEGWWGSLPGIKEAQEPAQPSSEGQASEMTFFKGLEKKDAAQKRTVKEYFLQVASFKEAHQAGRLAKRLKKAGHQVFVVRIKLKQLGVRYRVRVGPFPSSLKAKESAERIRRKHKLAAYLIRNR